MNMQRKNVKNSLSPDDFSITLRVAPAKRKMMEKFYGLSKAKIYRLLEAKEHPDIRDFQILIRRAAINIYGAQLKPE